VLLRFKPLEDDYLQHRNARGGELPSARRSAHGKTLARYGATRH
jgi:hypothetical protein